MNVNLKLSILWVAILSWIISNNVVNAEPLTENASVQQIVIAADEWCPYNCQPDSDQPGYMVEMVQQGLELVAPGRYTVKYTQVPWERAMKLARIGDKVHGIIGAIASEAEGLHVPIQSQGLMYAKLFVRSSNDWRYENIAQMISSCVKFGAISGYDYSEQIAAFIVQHPKQVELVYGDPALPKLIKFLMVDRVDTIIEDQAVFWYNVKTLGHDRDSFREAGGIDQPQNLYVAFHDKQVAELVSRGTVELREKGLLDAILKKYNLQDWQ